MLVELSVNDEVLHRNTIQPSGLHNDGVLALFRKFTLDTGDINLRLKISTNPEGDKIDNPVEVFQQSFNLESSSILIVEYTDSGFSASQPNQNSVVPGDDA